MSPVLARLTLGDAEYVLRAYSTFYTLAWVLGPAVATWFAHRRGLPWPRVLAVYAPALAGGIVGARALDLFVASRYYDLDPARVWGAFAGYSLYGGLVIATLLGIALARAWRLPVWRLADAAVPGLVLAQVLMRIGCLLNGCCYGLPTDLPWGVTYPTGSPVWLSQFTSGTQGLLTSFAGVVAPVHPTQLYEVAGALVFGGVALWLMGRGRGRAVADGVPFLVYALGFTLVRLGNHFLRARQPVVTAPAWFYPAAYVALALVIAALLVWRAHSQRGGGRAAGAEDTADMKPGDDSVPGRHGGPPTAPLPEPGGYDDTGEPE